MRLKQSKKGVQFDCVHASLFAWMISHANILIKIYVQMSFSKKNILHFTSPYKKGICEKYNFIKYCILPTKFTKQKPLTQKLIFPQEQSHVASIYLKNIWADSHPPLFFYCRPVYANNITWNSLCYIVSFISLFCQNLNRCPRTHRK